MSSCWMTHEACWMGRSQETAWPKPSVTVVYVCVCGVPEYRDKAMRFGMSYLKHPPRYPHQTLVLFNNGRPTPVVSSYLAGLGKYQSYQHSNAGWDIGALLAAYPMVKTDLLLFLGAHDYFHREGWLLKIADAYQNFGPGMYGCFSSYAVRPHLNTSAFAVSTFLLDLFRDRVMSKGERYEFEHGKTSLWRRVQACGLPTMLVTWDGVWPPERWREPRNILWDGDQSNCLVWDNHVDNYREEARQKSARRGELAAFANTGIK
jgi:hypothetical protein